MNQFNVNGVVLDEAARERFVAGYEKAGGYMGDVDTGSPAPWCAPWTWSGPVRLSGVTPEEWGAAWWRRVRKEVEEQLSGE